MITVFARWALIACILLPTAAAAEPIKLKLAFFTSDRISLYVDMIKPFVDAVNNEAPDLLQIEVTAAACSARRQLSRCNWCWMELPISLL